MSPDYNELQQLVDAMTLEEKLQLTTGSGCWNTAEIKRLNIPSVTVSDGPVGLRKESNGQTVPAVAFPSISKLACSFDTAVCGTIGSLIGEQCRSQNVNVILAPAINIKRNPRCGRNFEYFSEDPLLTAELATAYIKGVNSQGVGVCVKHFAGNSQEYGRHVCDSVMDTRALREIYLRAFERVVRDASPCAIMCAYNKLNDEYCSQHKTLLTDILRTEWGFQGIVMSDWGATDVRSQGIAAGLDLQMPQGSLDEVRKAINGGTLTESQLDQSVLRILKFAFSFDNTPRTCDPEQHHTFARKISGECTVLAKNNCNLLPFAPDDEVALIGLLADTPYMQGGGSSKVNPYKIETVKQGFEQLQVKFRYAQGYTLDGDDEKLLQEAVDLAAQCSKVLLVVGDYGSESECFDRKSLTLPDAQLKVIDAVTSVNCNVAIAVQSGAPVDVSWHNSAKALLIDYLSGEGAASLADVVYGKTCPCGRLAEIWWLTPPPVDSDFSANCKRALYRESIFVGYRYFTTANVDVAFPFGHGLNYNRFKWSNVSISSKQVAQNGNLQVKLTLENCGTREDAETVQVYVTNLDGKDFYAKKNLVAFKKVRLKASKSAKVTVDIAVNDFASYNVEQGKFSVNGGRYLVTVARDCNDIGFAFEVTVEGANDSTDNSDKFPCYYNVDENFYPTDSQFESLCGGFPEQSVTPFTVNSPLCDLTTCRLGKKIVKRFTKDLSETDKNLYLSTPFKMIAEMRPDLSEEMVITLVEMLNGKVYGNLFRLWRQSARCKRRNKTKTK